MLAVERDIWRNTRKGVNVADAVIGRTGYATGGLGNREVLPEGIREMPLGRFGIRPAGPVSPGWIVGVVELDAARN